MTEQTNPLSDLSDLARRAHYHISFRPEDRGKRVVNSYGTELSEDLQKLNSLGATPEQLARYAEKYKVKISAWLHSLSNTASAMITGPSNFPTRRMEKRNRWADNHYNVFRQWRDKVISAYERQARKAKVEAEGGELAIQRKKLANLQAHQEHMRKVNAAHRAFLKNPATLDAADFSEDVKKMIREYVPEYGWIPNPYARFQMSNNLANIKRVQERVAVLEKKEKMAEQVGIQDLTFQGGLVVLNHEIDRLQILFDEKPNQEMITNLKKNGFKWAPSSKAWQRQLTMNAKRAASSLLQIAIK